ncbi:type II CRISPR-associated endonuclease Cas1 [Falsiroseomonas sp. CW058]|uniref:type II CRISPR-associated endonuclease Cas1 n=1 Tax=Falsiroseomonas sp. CW058 TaxID=3388664 RepID=UPI003D3101A6
MEIAEDGRHLSKDRGFLTVSSQGEELGRLPIEDLAGVIATGHGTTLSLNLASALAEQGVPLVLCGPNFVPASVLWPIVGHHAQQRRMEAQIARTRVLAKRLWAEIVAAKVLHQGWALREAVMPSGAFVRLASLVKAGDPENIEAQAARRYWPLMFGKEFRRDADGEWPNPALNYGYAVLRAAVVRAVCAAGLHPSIGIFHRHPQNAMALADDLMEPFRPMVDLAVLGLVRDGTTTVTPASKRLLVGVLSRNLPTKAGTTPLSTCVQRLAQSLAGSYADGAISLDLPVLGLAPGRADEGWPAADVASI